MLLTRLSIHRKVLFHQCIPTISHIPVIQLHLHNSSRPISLFRRRPLYKPTTVFGRTYLRLRNFTLGLITISAATFAIFYVLDARSAIHRYVFTPALRLLTPNPEDAHRLAILSLKYGLHPKDTRPDDPRLAVEVQLRDVTY